MKTICEQAIELAGGPKKLSEAIGALTPQAVSQWKRVPADRAIAVEALTGISRHDLRPDIFGLAPAQEGTVDPMPAQENAA